jgi:hypothetical protein
MNPVAQDISNAIAQATPVVGQSECAQTGSEIRRVTIVEIGPETRRVLAEIEADLKRLADHFDPQPSDVVGTPYLADRLGCTATWIAQMVRSGEIPKGCIVPGSGKGRQWKFYRGRIEEWLASR